MLSEDWLNWCGKISFDDVSIYDELRLGFESLNLQSNSDVSKSFEHKNSCASHETLIESL